MLVGHGSDDPTEKEQPIGFMKPGGEVWILAEQRSGRLEDISLELLAQGLRIAGKLDSKVGVLVLGRRDERLGCLIAHHGADKIYFLEDPRLESYSPELYTHVLTTAIREHKPEILLCGATLVGKDLAPRLAARLKTGLISNCNRLQVDGEGRILFTKPTHGGKVDSTLICPTARPQIATFRPGIGEKARANSTREAESVPLTFPFADITFPRVTRFLKAEQKTLSLEDAEVVIAGGKGVGSAKNFRILEELAEVLGGTVAGSRQAIDEKWLPSHRLVGQSGKTVAPRLYVACGISGAAQHTMGMKDSDIIVAINTDRNAPIFGLAHVGVVGDLREVVPAITDQVRHVLSGSTSGRDDGAV